MTGKLIQCKPVLSVIALLFLACTSEESLEEQIQEDLILNAVINEYPAEETIISTINSSLTGELTYTLANTTVNDAIIINSSSGELIVNNSFAFDFERTSQVTGTVIVSNGSNSEEWSIVLTIRDIDDIGYWLTDSKAVYEAEDSGNWVAITKVEYEELTFRISGISKIGTTDILYEQGTSAGVYETYENVTVSNDLSSIPEDSYVFAFRYLALADQITGNKIKVTESGVLEGYTDLGNTLPPHNQGERFFVLKGATKSTTENRGFLGVYSQNGVSYDIDGNAAGTHYFSQGDTNTLDDQSNLLERVCIYQGLSTPIKQWN